MGSTDSELLDWTKECHKNCVHNTASGIQVPKMEDEFCMLDGIYMDDERNCLSYQTQLDYALERACVLLTEALRKDGATEYAKLLIDIDTGEGTLEWRRKGDTSEVE